MSTVAGVLEGLTPIDLGFHYPEFRPAQLEAIERALYNDKDVIGLGLPPGAGKSLCAMAIAKLSGQRTVILTATKGLQTQYATDFRDHIADIRGRGNYHCPVARDCEEGWEAGCVCAQSGGYQSALNLAQVAPIVVSNYACWLHTPTLNDADILILDEATEASEQLSKYLHLEFTEAELRKMRIVDLPPKVKEFDKWYKWAANLRHVLSVSIAGLESRVLTPAGQTWLHRLRRLQEKLKRVGTLNSGWVFDYETGTGAGQRWQWDVVDVRPYTKHLLKDSAKVILMSATLKRKHLEDLNLAGDFNEWGRVFPKQRSPIYLCAARINGKAVRIDRKTSEGELEAWTEHIDKIIDQRLDRKGILHSVSYARQQYLMEHSRHRSIMLGNTAAADSETASEAAQRFRQLPAPSLLVSPSFGTGWNFPHSECRYVIVAKVPFPSNQSAIVRARQKIDPDYLTGIAIQDLVQSAMRGMRAADDWCEVIITDDHLRWLLGRAREMIPRWFQDGVYIVGKIPSPLDIK